MSVCKSCPNASTASDQLFVQVSVAFSDKTVRPADTVTVTVSADPASYFGLLAVDQSVLLLREGNDITRDSVSSSPNNISFS